MCVRAALLALMVLVCALTVRSGAGAYDLVPPGTHVPLNVRLSGLATLTLRYASLSLSSLVLLNLLATQRTMLPRIFSTSV